MSRSRLGIQVRRRGDISHPKVTSRTDLSTSIPVSYGARWFHSRQLETRVLVQTIAPSTEASPTRPQSAPDDQCQRQGCRCDLKNRQLLGPRFGVDEPLD